MELSSHKKTWFVSGGISLIATQPQDSSLTMLISTITLRLVNKLTKDKRKEDKAPSLMISQLQELLQMLHIQLQVAHKHHHHHSEVLLVQVHHIQLLLQAINHLVQLVVPTTLLHLRQEVIIQLQQLLVVLLAIHLDLREVIQALKDLIQALVQVLLQLTCHHHPTSHHKDINHHHSLILHTQHKELLKLQTVTTCHPEEVKLMQTIVYISFLMLSSHPITKHK